MPSLLGDYWKFWRFACPPYGQRKHFKLRYKRVSCTAVHYSQVGWYNCTILFCGLMRLNYSHVWLYGIERIALVEGKAGQGVVSKVKISCNMCWYPSESPSKNDTWKKLPFKLEKTLMYAWSFRYFAKCPWSTPCKQWYVLLAIEWSIDPLFLCLRGLNKGLLK